ncbi:DUF2442 domain-containing protein [Hyphomicrobium sp.]|uniref:DUF2442 domain-containing protein n=1 Tax=Hyphomicrobium sp. TaxID=82 RepID=UPI000F9E9571|nr:DUF2442 domain-containing protein [Hyphomicrobium sp.]RUO97997.1 MAG: DUF2442 domain-containing protein [Hyphomicrobium sp.]
MAISEKELAKAKERGADVRAKGYALAAKYDRNARAIAIKLDSGTLLTVPIEIVRGLRGASATKIADVEVIASGLGLHWPQLDLDLYVPSLLAGKVNPQSFAAATLGAAGGRSTSEAKAAAARENGKRGGRPKILTVDTKPHREEARVARRARRG